MSWDRSEVAADPSLHPHEAECTEPRGQAEGHNSCWRNLEGGQDRERHAHPLDKDFVTEGAGQKASLSRQLCGDAGGLGGGAQCGDEPDEELLIAQMAEQGDEDAIFVAEYEDQITEYIQDQPELAPCFSAYVAAPDRLRDCAKSRGFWPSRSKKNGKGAGCKGRVTFPSRKTLAERIAT